MVAIADNDLIIYNEDTVQLYEYIDVIKVSGGYRIHNVCSGYILKVDVFTALVANILKKRVSFDKLMYKLNLMLPEIEIEHGLVKGIIEYFLDIGFLELNRGKYNTKIMLINPCYRYSNNVYKKISIVPLLGILYIATELFNAGYNVFILDILLEYQ